MWSDAGGQQGKYILYALAQRALAEYEDQELDIRRYPSGTVLEAIHEDLRLSLSEGAVLFMDGAHRIGLHAHEGTDVVAMLRAFHRYATRMIRLDVR